MIPLQTSSKHVPYRDSKLTYLLSDRYAHSSLSPPSYHSTFYYHRNSLGGNSLTLMITCVTPTLANFDESVSTLRFAERVKKVKNAAKVNVDATMMRIMQLEAEIKGLRDLLAKCTCGNAARILKDQSTLAIGEDGPPRRAGHDAWTMAHTVGVDAATSTKLPWWKRLLKQCTGGMATGAAGAKTTLAKVTPIVTRSVPTRSVAMGDDDEGEETVLKSVKGKLTFVK